MLLTYYFVVYDSWWFCYHSVCGVFSLGIICYYVWYFYYNIIMVLWHKKISTKYRRDCWYYHNMFTGCGITSHLVLQQCILSSPPCCAMLILPEVSGRQRGYLECAIFSNHIRLCSFICIYILLGLWFYVYFMVLLFYNCYVL